MRWINRHASFRTRGLSPSSAGATHTGDGLRSRLATVVLAFSVVTTASAQAPQASEAPQALQTIPLQAGFHRITAQVARTPDHRQIGLMHRKSMPDHEGMLFVFDDATVQCFWMKNTLLPLSAAFVRDDGSIVNIVDMKPQTLDSHCSTEPVRYVLEMNQGWFAKRALGPGKKLTGAPFEQRR